MNDRLIIWLSVLVLSGCGGSATDSPPLVFDLDGDGVQDLLDAFPQNPAESKDSDSDGIGDNADTDDDNDGISDIDEINAGTDPLDSDTDKDGVNDAVDVFPLNDSESIDTDNDGIGNNTDSDDDGDGVDDTTDAFPLDPSETLDTDGDGIGNNADTDDDGDGVDDTTDAFPLDPSETLDTDGDGIGNNADTDDDGDGIPDVLDTDNDNDGVDNSIDAFPNDPSESVDSDGDGMGNNADTDDDGDGVDDVIDAFPLDATETLDTDGDGIGNNADTDDDNDGILDLNDSNPLVFDEPVIQGGFYRRDIAENTGILTSILPFDLDKDGDMDVIVSKIDTSTSIKKLIAWYENTGDMQFVEHLVDTNRSGVDSIYAADIDIDGDVDLVTTSGYVSWFKNDGNQNFTEHDISSTVSNNISSTVLTDLNGDGFIDIFAARSSTKTISNNFDYIWYQSNQSLSFLENRFDLGFSSYIVNSYSVDVDKDGDKDIAVALGSDATIAWLENNGAGAFSTHVINTIDNGPNTFYSGKNSVYPIDLDKDGDMDFVTALHLYPQEIYRTISWFENNGNFDFIEHNVSSSFDISASLIFASDIDQDSDIDLIAASAYTSGIALYQNDGDQNFTEYLINISNYGEIYLIDFDLDGDIDILMDTGNENGLIWLENVGFQWQ